MQLQMDLAHERNLTAALLSLTRLPSSAVPVEREVDLAALKVLSRRGMTPSQRRAHALELLDKQHKEAAEKVT